MKQLAIALALPLLFVLPACGGADDTVPADVPEEAASSATAADDSTPYAADDASADRDMETLAAETEDNSATASDNAPAARTISAIPAAFRGTWATDPANCTARNHERFTVTQGAVRFFEGGGTATAIRRNGSALAVSYDETNESMNPGPAVVYFASLDNGGAMRVKRGDGDSIRYTRCIERSEPSASAASKTVPARFRATYAPDRRACDGHYDYQPTFQNVDVTADRVMFFENGGPVQNVNVNGDAVAITFLDTYADQSNRRVIYLRLNGDGSARYRSGPEQPVQTFVRCG